MNELSLEQILLCKLNNGIEVGEESYTYQSVFLSSIVPDEDNARFLPAILMDDEHAKLLVNRKLTKNHLIKTYYSEDHVLIGKSSIINCFQYGSIEWKKANVTIESIIELGNNIATSELIQVPTLYPIDNGMYKIMTGHRRFFSLVYANGYGSSAQFKVYDTKPVLTKIKQFQENASREDLPQYGKLQAFLNAMNEIHSLNNARLKSGLKKLTIRETSTVLGISMGGFDNYNVLIRYKSVLSAYERGASFPFVKVKKVVLEVESAYKINNGKSQLNITDKDNISAEIESRLFDKTKNIGQKSFKLKSMKSSNAVQILLKTNIMELYTEVDWETIDWNDHALVSNILSDTIEYIEKKYS